MDGGSNKIRRGENKGENNIYLESKSLEDICYTM